MTQQPAGDRLQKLQEMLRRQPNDTFLLYGLAMEYKKAGDTARATEHFDRVIQIDAGYCYAYFQKGQTFELAGNPDAARRAYQDGVEAAKKKGDEHARQEIEAALNELSW